MSKEDKLKDLYVRRDVSWMYFNHRILQEAEKENIPLLERLSFLGIYSNNLDEFFRVRVASLNRVMANESVTKKARQEIKKTIKTINKLNEDYSKEYTAATDKVFRELEQHGIHVLNETQLSEEQQRWLRQFYYDRLNGFTNPIWLSEVKNLSKLEDNRIYLIIEASPIEEGKSHKKKYAIIKIPDKSIGRWVILPSTESKEERGERKEERVESKEERVESKEERVESKEISESKEGGNHKPQTSNLKPQTNHKPQTSNLKPQTCIMYLDDVIRFCLPLIFTGFRESRYRAYSFKFTKDAEMEVDNEADYGTMERIAIGVDSRKRGEPIRVIYDKDMPEEMQKKILERLDMRELDTTLAGGRYQNHKDLMKFPSCGHDELKYPAWQHIMKPEFLSKESILDLIREKDRFIHVPYHSFDAYIRVLREAALKPEVKEIKTTLYRLAKDSKVVKALICAARNGKKVTAVVELLARFDEESNIKWSKRMQEEGVNVIFGVEGLKIHSKLLYISSKKGDIACVGTGNFHEGNAKTYTDYLMMTARPAIVQEVAKVFQFIDRPFQPVRFNQLLVSPNSMKNRLLHLFDVEIANAKDGKEAWVKMKINHITDVDMVAKIYEASQAGVKVEIVIRGNCSLVPGVPGVSDNIKAIGIIDRYLEHSRILIFCNGGRRKFYLGSADWMPRNLESRIEVMTPVFDEDLKADLLRTVEYGLRDTTNGRVVDGRGTNALQEGEPFRSQEELNRAYSSLTL